MSSPILYLCQAYSKYEQVPRDAYDMHDAYAFAINTYRELIGMGFDVFSPIMYTHPFHLAMRQPNIDYVAHDLKMLAEFKEVVCVFAEDCFTKQILHWGFHDRLTIECQFATSHCPLNQFETCESCDLFWQSHGAKAEYDFAHAHNILCVPLTKVLEKGKIDEGDAF